MVLELIKSNDKGKIYQAEGFKILYRFEGVVAGDNAINVEEVLYFITGSAEITLGNKTWVIESPARVDIPAQTY